MTWKKAFQEAREILLRQQEVYKSHLAIIVDARKLKLGMVIPNEAGIIFEALRKSEASLLHHNRYIEDLLGTIKEIGSVVECNDFNVNCCCLVEIMLMEIKVMEKDWRCLYKARGIPFSISAGELIAEGISLLIAKINEYELPTKI